MDDRKNTFLYKLIFLFISITLILINTNKVSSQADFGGAVEVIYSNLNIINNSIYKIKSQMKSLESSLNYKLREQSTDLKKNKDDILRNTYDIDSLKNEMSVIDHSYNNLQEKYNDIIKEFDMVDIKILKVDSSHGNLKSQIYDIKEKMVILSKLYFELKNEFSKIPEIMFCQNCAPQFAFDLSYNIYYNFGNTNVFISNSIMLEWNYIFNNSFSLWINYNAPSFITKTKDQNNFNISDSWMTHIVSFGSYYNFMDYKYISFKLGVGAFYGIAAFDKYLNNDFGYSRNILDASSYGLVIKPVISYSEFYSKNPIEIYIALNSFISYKNIILDPGLNVSHDLGNTLLFVSFGIKYNFWNL